ncbi:hypothetical protein HZS61_010232 [Fusarium oxysporum f. sp. conglutinans]|uniref:AAA+ ATPase domain-containing protein n=1 Tax=Fusarium oxysporum f. sp. conglutinans TaxID=100902 RepID=A0A8H6GYY4_FUSOX|nr:hypothetical protein HZS61_010232 [Fusarium oxysporum f. sp. conglutinans]
MGSPWFTRSDEHNPKNQDHQNNSGNPVEVGMAAETKDIYRKSSWDPWQEWTEEEIGVDGRSSQASAKYALIVRREKEHGEIDESVLSLHSITVQSPLLKKILGPVFKGYKGIKPNLKKLEFHAPFREFFYRWDEFTQADPRNDSADSSEECSHYKLLADIIHAEIKPRIEQASDLLNNGVISFDYVWTLFEPDIEVYTTVEGRDRLFRLSSSNYSKTPDGTVAYVLCARFIDTDGDTFGYTETTLNILPFENVKPILELEVIPARLCPHLDEVKDRLVQRGRVFESLKGIHHRTYSGRGIIMLLSGEPGTGKTLTAESVSEIMQKPLYNMSAAELGDVAQEVEQKLDCALELSTRWGAVLLLDECDVFLERRTTSDIKRNKLVSIFLRLLEYFEGVMFLTTNRVSAFDPAFESRIHLTIHYPNLDYTSRLHIWRTFVNIGTDGNSLSEDELDELAGVELNGRQIKNVVKTARLLATHERTQLAMGHISTVLRIKKGLAGGS